MARYETATLLLSILAVCVSLATAIYAGRLSEKQASSDYRAREQVKSDTASLLATLRSFMHKGALASTSPEAMDLQPEREAVSKFLTSQTGFAYYSWIDEKSAQAIREGRKEESWRLFFLYLSELASADNIHAASRRAADVELLFDGLSESDMERIADFNADLVQAISENSQNREGNVVVKALVESRREMRARNTGEKLEAKLRFLKGLGIQDPNIDMFLATMSGDVAQLESALKAGADVQMTDADLLRKYESELREFGR